MGKKVASSGLLDQFGRPMSFSFFEGADRTTRREQQFFFYEALNDFDQLLPVGDWRQAVSSSRFVFANVPVIRGAIMEQARYSFPLTARYTGADRNFGRQGEQWLFEWKKNNNVRGRPYNGHVNSRVRMIARKIDGDIVTALVGGKGTVFPQLQYIRAHRIHDRTALMEGGRLKKGPYKGFKCLNGVITTDYGRHVAYLVPGQKEEEEQYFAAGDVFMTFDPEYADQTRGFPELLAAVKNAADLKRLDEYEMRAQQICASLTVIEKNATGTADEASEAVLRNTTATADQKNGTPSGLTVETYGAGMIRYLKSGDGSGLEAFRGDRPSADARAWEEKIVARMLYGQGWDPNFALAIKEPGGAWARTILQKINHVIRENVRIEATDQAREDFWAVTWAVGQGLLPAPSDGDLHSWEYELEALPISADTGNDEAAKREGYKLGTTTLRAIYAGNGKWWIEERDQREVETRDLLERAKRLQSEFPELSLIEILGLLEQRTPNGPTQPAAAETSEGGDGDEGKSGEEKKA